jgi:hypothetical protein
MIASYNLNNNSSYDKIIIYPEKINFWGKKITLSMWKLTLGYNNIT